MTNVLVQPTALGRLSLPNRLAVAPMTRVSASVDGLASARMQDYYAGFAEGGFGLVITEGLYTDQAFAQGYAYQPGMASGAQRDAWKPLVATVQQRGARFVAQLMHAGALSQANIYRTGTRGASVVQPKGQQMTFYRGSGPYALPAAMTQAEIDEAAAGFAQAAAHAAAAGFDGVEIHAANGYLLDQFITEATNQRSDRYGGEVEQRLQLLREVVAAIRAEVGADFPVGVRISQGKVNDFHYKWRGEAEATALFRELAALPLDFVHVTEFEAWQPAFEGSPCLAQLARQHSGLPVIANGSLHDPAQATTLVQRGHADVISLGRGALTHADWPNRLRQGLPLEAFDPAILSPIADLK